MTKIHEYFQSERYESLAFVVIGTTAIVCGFYFWLVINTNFYNGLGWPLLFIAIVQMFVSIYVYFRSLNDEKRVVTLAKTKPKNIKNLEIPRMEKVMTKFKFYRYFENGFIILGLVLFLISSEGGFWKGAGLGIIIQTGLILIADLFAEKRGQNYFNYLKNTFR